MPTTSKKGRSRVALLAVVAMLTTLVAFAAPAGALDSAACPQASIPSAGFNDLGGVPTDAVDAIDCIAFYDISLGTSATTFSPFTDVPRWQMALFLARSAAVMGVTLPDPTSQGYTDLAGVPSAAVDAINQISELGISQGTSTTTFDPFSDVERWQMALFLTRLLSEAGETLPSGASGPFTDLAGVPAAAVEAINQVAAMGVALGTSATTFSPFTDVERWQMALFLARALQVAGVTPGAVADLNVTPNTAVTLNAVANPDTDNSDDRQYVVSNPVADTTHTIALFPADEVSIGAGGGVVFGDDEGGANQADDLGNVAAWITVVNGTAVAADQQVVEVMPSGGQITFTVDGAGAEDVVPVVFFDADGDNQLDLQANNTPVDAEVFGIGGEINYLPGEAAAGSLAADAAIVSVDKADDHFTTAGALYEYDSNDVFYIDDTPTAADEADTGEPAEQVTMAEFEAQLSTGDQISAGTVYQRNDAFVSTFILEDLAPAAPTIASTDAGESTVTATLTAATVATGATVTLKVVADGAACTATAVATATATTDADTTTAEFQITASGLEANTAYEACVMQTVGGETSPFATVGFTTDATAAPTFVSATPNDLDDGVGSTQQVRFTFSEPVVVNDATGFTVIPEGQPAFSLSGVSATVSGSTVIVTLDGTLNDVTPGIEYDVTIDAGAVEDPGGLENAAINVNTADATVQAFTY